MQSENRDYTKIMQIYNESGSKAANDFIQSTYGIKYPASFLTAMKKSEKYQFNKEQNRFILEKSPKQAEPSVFLGLEELCATPAVESFNHMQKNNHNDINSLIKELMEEKLLELTKYIQMNRSSNTVTINKTDLIKAGYKVAIY